MGMIQRLVVGELATNCYLVQIPNSEKCLIIDPGGDGEQILERIREMECSVSHILLTHGHADHIAGIPNLKQAFPEAQVVIHELDAPMLEDLSASLGDQFGVSREKIEPDVLLKKGQTEFRVNDQLTFEIIETPGHSPGSVCFYLPPKNAVDAVGKANEGSDPTNAGISADEGSDPSLVATTRPRLFSGDILFCGGLGRTDLPGGNYQQEIRSIREKLLILPPQTRVYPGHGPPTTIGEEAANLQTPACPPLWWGF